MPRDKARSPQISLGAPAAAPATGDSWRGGGPGNPLHRPSGPDRSRRETAARPEPQPPLDRITARRPQPHPDCFLPHPAAGPDRDEAGRSHGVRRHARLSPHARARSAGNPPGTGHVSDPGGAGHREHPPDARTVPDSGPCQPRASSPTPLSCPDSFEIGRSRLQAILARHARDRHRSPAPRRTAPPPLWRGRGWGGGT